MSLAQYTSGNRLFFAKMVLLLLLEKGRANVYARIEQSLGFSQRQRQTTPANDNIVSNNNSFIINGGVPSNALN